MKASDDPFVKVLSSTTSLWFLFLLTGGVVFAVYYARIGYLPDIEWQSALSYLAAASMIGASLTLLLAFLIVVPGVIWTTQLTHDEKLETLFCEGNRISYRFIGNLIAWLLLSAGLMHWVLVSDGRWLPALFVVLFLAKAVSIWFFEIPRCPVKDRKAQVRLLLFYGFWYSVSIASVLAAIYVMFKFLGLSDSRYVWAHFLICIIGVVFANAVVTIFLHQKQWVTASALAFFLSVAIIVVGDYFDHVPEEILGHYGFGVRHVQLIVSEEAYKTLQAQGVVAANPPPGAKAIPEVRVLCRMGPNYFVTINDRNVTLRKSDVLSWSAVAREPLK